MKHMDFRSSRLDSGPRHFFFRVRGGAGLGLFSSLESRGIGLGPVLDVGLDLWDLLHLLVVGLQQEVLVLRGKKTILTNKLHVLLESNKLKANVFLFWRLVPQNFI